MSEKDEIVYVAENESTLKPTRCSKCKVAMRSADGGARECQKCGRRRLPTSHGISDARVAPAS